MNLPSFSLFQSHAGFKSQPWLFEEDFFWKQHNRYNFLPTQPCKNGCSLRALWFIHVASRKKGITFVSNVERFWGSTARRRGKSSKFSYLSDKSLLYSQHMMAVFGLVWLERWESFPARIISFCLGGCGAKFLTKSQYWDGLWFSCAGFVSNVNIFLLWISRHSNIKIWHEINGFYISTKLIKWNRKYVIASFCIKPSEWR